MKLASGAAWLLLVTCADVSAHAQDSGQAAGAGARWEAAVLLLLASSALVYAVGVYRAWRSVGVGRGITRARVAAFTSAWGVVALALLSPLDKLGDVRFSLHMLQHELLMVLAAPLLCLARPLVAALWALPASARARVLTALRRPGWARPWQLAAGPAGSWMLHAAALWLWHLPRAFEAALLHPAWHTLQHTSFLVSALLFWWAVLKPMPRAATGSALLGLFSTLLHTSALGALLALSSHPWYALYAESAAEAGLDALQDQQLGGLLMWAPGGLAYVLAGLALAAQSIRGPAPRTGRDAAAPAEG